MTDEQSATVSSTSSTKPSSSTNTAIKADSTTGVVLPTDMTSKLLDATSLTSVTTTSSAKQISIVSQTATETSLANNNGTQEVETSHGGLSSGAKVGLGVGLGLVTPLLILLLALLFFLRRRRRQQQRAQVDSKYTPQAESKLSMIEPSYPIPAGPPRSDQAREAPVRHSQAYHGSLPAPQFSFDEPVSAVTQEDDQFSKRQSAHPSLTLQIPELEDDSVRSRDVSPVRGGSPVSPVSPISFNVSTVSRSPTPKA